MSSMMVLSPSIYNLFINWRGGPCIGGSGTTNWFCIRGTFIVDESCILFDHISTLQILAGAHPRGSKNIKSVLMLILTIKGGEMSGVHSLTVVSYLQ